jgi:xylulokinase
VDRADSRAVEELATYAALSPEVLARQGNPLTPGMAGPMLSWLRRHEPASYAEMRWALQPKDWLRAQLTGQLWSEPSEASATLLYDLDADNWDVCVLQKLGVDRALVPDLLSCSARRAGELTTRCGDLLGLPRGIPVAVGAADTAAASTTRPSWRAPTEPRSARPPSLATASSSDASQSSTPMFFRRRSDTE